MLIHAFSTTLSHSWPSPGPCLLEPRILPCPELLSWPPSPIPCVFLHITFTPWPYLTDFFLSLMPPLTSPMRTRMSAPGFHTFPACSLLHVHCLAQSPLSKSVYGLNFESSVYSKTRATFFKEMCIIIENSKAWLPDSKSETDPLASSQMDALYQSLARPQGPTGKPYTLHRLTGLWSKELAFWPHVRGSPVNSRVSSALKGFTVYWSITKYVGLPWWSSGWASTCPCRFDRWSRKMPPPER